MRIPESPRVVFSKNPLAEVVCQLKFPRLLEIDGELPVDYHRSVRKLFPEFTLRPTLEISLTDLQAGNAPSRVFRNHYDFATEDGKQKVTLTGDFVALTFSDYISWSEFRERTDFVLTALTQIYEIPHLSRVGLRYRDIIDRAVLGLQNQPWNTLLRPEVLGILGTDMLDDGDVAEFSATYFAKMGSDQVRISTGLVDRVDSSETGFLIDTDFSNEERTEATGNVCNKILDRYNTQAGNLFRWCITDRLRDALGPT